MKIKCILPAIIIFAFVKKFIQFIHYSFIFRLIKEWHTIRIGIRTIRLQWIEIHGNFIIPSLVINQVSDTLLYTFDVIFSKITSVRNTSEEAVSIRYESGELYVQGMNAGDKLDIYDITGKYIRTSTISKTDVADLADGCYLVRVSLGNAVKTAKFIKR